MDIIRFNQVNVQKLIYTETIKYVRNRKVFQLDL